MYLGVVFRFYLDCFCSRFGACLGSLFSSEYIKSYSATRGGQNPSSAVEKGRFCLSRVQCFLCLIFIRPSFGYLRTFYDIVRWKQVITD